MLKHWHKHQFWCLTWWSSLLNTLNIFFFFYYGFTQANLARKNDFSTLVKKRDFVDKLKDLNEKITSNKTKHVLAENELNELSEKVKILSEKDSSFFLGRIYFTSNDRSQNMFVYQPVFTVL